MLKKNVLQIVGYVFYRSKILRKSINYSTTCFKGFVITPDALSGEKFLHGKTDV